MDSRRALTGFRDAVTVVVALALRGRCCSSAGLPCHLCLPPLITTQMTETGVGILELTMAWIKMTSPWVPSESLTKALRYSLNCLIPCHPSQWGVCCISVVPFY